MENKNIRLYNLDYLRGLAAFGIMIYHYFSTIYGVSSDTTLSRIGVYGVSIFYILSGLTLYQVYESRMTPTLADLMDFFQKRFFRIFPLLWLVIIVTILINENEPSVKSILLNFTGLFGFVSWHGSIAGGGWSIGNELVFYCLFPIFIYLSKFHKAGFWIFSATIFGLFIFFCFKLLDSNSTMVEEWKDYTNPLNQAFLFLLGFMIAKHYKQVSLNKIVSLILIAAGVLLFIFMPTKQGDPIIIATEYNRIIFTFCAAIVCLGFYKLTLKLPDLIHKPLILLGEASYSVYLFHLIIMRLVTSLNERTYNFPYSYTILPAIIITLIVSYFVYEYFEKYFVTLGKSLKLAKQKA